MSDENASGASQLIHREVMELVAPPGQVRRFIFTPERILDYYPMPVEGGVFAAGQAFYCRGEMGVSLLEAVPSEVPRSGQELIVLKVTTAIALEGPYTRERIEANATFIMFEDWLLEASGTGTKLTKSWRDIESPGPEPFPLAQTIKDSAIHESPQLVAAWDKAAR